MDENKPSDATSLIELAGEITIAWLQNPNVQPGAQDVPAFLQQMHAAISVLTTPVPAEPETVTYQPKVPVRTSVKPDHLVSLIDGKKYKTLKRHLAQDGLTPDAYRERYGLKPDYPMVAEDYANARRDIAKKLGLGRKPAVKTAVAEAPGDAASPAKPAKSKGRAGKANAAAIAAPSSAPETPEMVTATTLAQTGTAVPSKPAAKAKAASKAKAAAPKTKPAAPKAAAKAKAPARKKASAQAASAKPESAEPPAASTPAS